MFRATDLWQTPKFDLFQEPLFFYFSVTNIFGTKSRFKCSWSVFAKTFYFLLLGNNYFWSFHAFSKKLKLKRKFSDNHGKIFGWSFSRFSTIFLHHKWIGTRLLSPKNEWTNFRMTKDVIPGMTWDLGS